VTPAKDSPRRYLDGDNINMSKTNDTERTHQPKADRAELLDSELDTVIGGLVVVTPQNVTLLGPALLIPAAPPTTNGHRGTGGQIGP
jgi:hypothetical protein